MSECVPNLHAQLFKLSPFFFHFFLFLKLGVYLVTSLLHEEIEDLQRSQPSDILSYVVSLWFQLPDMRRTVIQSHCNTLWALGSWLCVCLVSACLCLKGKDVCFTWKTLRKLSRILGSQNTYSHEHLEPSGRKGNHWWEFPPSGTINSCDR